MHLCFVIIVRHIALLACNISWYIWPE